MAEWLMLHYKLPTKPSARRVYIWRKLKRLGAILLHEAVWVLPVTPKTAEQFQWLTAEIQEMEGEAYFWKADLVMEEQESLLVEQFIKQVDVMYSGLLEKLRRRNPDLMEISRQYQLTVMQDYFQSTLGQQVREKLLGLRGEKQ
jgi:hypothetical protein